MKTTAALLAVLALSGCGTQLDAQMTAANRDNVFAVTDQNETLLTASPMAESLKAAHRDRNSAARELATKLAERK